MQSAIIRRTIDEWVISLETGTKLLDQKFHSALCLSRGPLFFPTINHASIPSLMLKTLMFLSNIALKLS